MRAVLLRGHGDLEKLEMKMDVPVPQVGPLSVLIRVHAAAVNQTDINTRVGWYSKSDDVDDAAWTGEGLKFPLIQGIDVCGTIVATGKGVDAARIGERVLIEPCLKQIDGKALETPSFLGSECNGGFADYCVVASQHAHALKSTLTSVELASFPCSYSTAENMLERSKVGPDDRVLVTGASGGVGSAAVQLAKLRGAKVVAICGADKRDRLLAVGADQVIERGANLIEALGVNSVSVVVDLVAGPTWPDYLEVLKPGGRYAVAGAIGGHSVTLDVRTLYLKDLSFFGCTSLESNVFRNLIGYIEMGGIKPLIEATYPLEEIKQAQQAFAAKTHVGKVVLIVT